MVRSKLYYLKFFLIALAAAWPIGISLRFLSLQHEVVYTSCFLDQVFDWGGLLLVGCMMSIFAVYGFVKEVRYAPKRN